MRVRLSLDGCAHNTGGIARYAARLTKGLRDLSVDAILVAGITANPYLGDGAIALRSSRATRGVGPANRSLERLWNHVVPTDVHHKLWHSPLTPRRAQVVAVTVYDLIAELVSPTLQSTDEARAKRLWCRSADIVFAISETTKSDLVATFDLDPDKVFVTPLGTDVPLESVENTRREPSVLLYVGGRGGYKDFDTLLVAMSTLPNEISAVAVGPRFEAAEWARLHELRLAHRVSTVRADDDELRNLYRSAAVHVTTSRAEGFGLPLLEAMGASCPVVCSDAPALREVGRAAPTYFTAGSPEALRDAILLVLTDSERTGAHVEMGLARARQFTWHRTAEATLNGYRSVLA